MSAQGERSSGEWFWAGFFATLGGVFALFVLSLIPGIFIGVIYMFGKFDFSALIWLLGILLGLGLLYLMWVLTGHGLAWLDQRKKASQ